ncbi:Type 1 glutamine amidotransferase-like domain-containing protein [Desulfatitalea tepidiphila]|uniref:Type 1 glutamine amidotransferase-like domain-containing protein n=1 Tax=Desulfatitalea tepidiphila TaxID=1185843 RepID=UPI00128F5A41|nr:Type 1 glutamine amidotransferase-like domain-containing protein [Desulfatitalea tepidiphila]
MQKQPGVIALMGSGELTTTMVEVHKELLEPYGERAQAVFLDTPAGFQLNADDISKKAIDYFQNRVLRPLTVASLKSAEAGREGTVEQAYRRVREADYILVGPGSPTYALRHWKQTHIPELLVQRISEGGTFVAASAAALTVGRVTLPVYEIYKVGASPFWAEGLNLLARFGMNWAVIPHWNNAEGGNHDTRFCFMGAPRMAQLEAQLPDGTGLLGLDEHTALIIDLAQDRAEIRGMGSVTLRRHGGEQVFAKGDRIPLGLLRGEDVLDVKAPASGEPAGPSADKRTVADGEDRVWQPVEDLADKVQAHLVAGRVEPATQIMLELERHIADVREQLQERSAEGAAREALRGLIVLFGTHLARRPASRRDCLAPLVEPLLALRVQLREKKLWEVADAIRDTLQQAGVLVEDTAEGVRWHLIR